MSSRSKLIFFLLLFPALVTHNITATPISREDVPDPLKPWIGWVLHGDGKACPYLDGTEDSNICTWSSELRLSLSDRTGSFDQQWRVYTDAWVPLPGSDEQWPLDVRVDNTPAAVMLIDDQPQILLKKGEHSVTGSFLWDSAPESFQIPKDTGIFELTFKGVAVPFPSVDENGLVWFQGKQEEQQAEDSLQIRIHRHMSDDVPFVLTTRISLDVSGKTREVLLGPALFKDFIPMSLDSPLPLDIQPDGMLRVQARAGHWEIQLSARHQGPLSSLTLPPTTEGAEAPSVYRPDEEVWVFQAQNDLRLVSVEGVQAVDPQQTDLPDEWKSLPAYRLTPGETVRLVEQRRGDSSPAPDQLSLDRNYWLDFDGSGYTINDNIAGTLSSSRRLDMKMPIKLGRVSVNGDNQLITRLPGEDLEGFEVRHGQAQIVADSRFEEGAFSVPAIGWDHNFQRVSGLLHLPPGWKVFAVTGADHVPSTWLNRWSLLEIFLVLILAVSFARMWGKLWGLIAFLTFVLAFPESDSPQWIWLAVLVGSVLLRVIKKGRLLLVLKFYRLVTLLILIMICIPFAIDQIRLALYPSLEYSQQINTNQTLGSAELEQQIQQQNSNYSASYSASQAGGGGFQSMAVQNAAPMAPPPAPEAQQEAVPEEKAKKAARAEIPMTKALPSQLVNQLAYKKLNPTALVQTGPGLPRWEGNVVPLQWTGPVEKSQTLHFFLIPPSVSFVLSFLRVLLIALLILCVIGFPGGFWPEFMRKHLIPAGAATLFLFAGLLLLISPGVSHADFPSTDMLNELQQRLTESPECFPSCSSISRMQIEVAGGTLRIRLEAGAQDETAIPLPGMLSDWTPLQVLVDGQKFAELYRDEDGKLWLKLSPGEHQVILEGPLPKRQTVQIPLPMKPHHAEAKVDGWIIDGLHEDGLVDENLQLTRLESSSTEGKGETENKAGSLPPFVQIQRRLILGLNWQMETHVTRLTPAGSAVILEVPLLEGESVTTPGLRIQSGKVQVSMGPQVSEMQWSSVLKERKAIHLRASDSISWTEVWLLDASPLWHVTLEGIPVIHQQSTEGTWLPEWHPWPGEKVDITIMRPEGVKGPTVTIDQSLLSITPGLRYSESTLNLNLRSSLGGQHILTLPEKAELQSVSINGVVQPIRNMEQKVTLPLIPGEQRVELTWQQPGGINSFFRSPVVGLGLPSVNSETQLHLPADRWIFLVGGPGVGPAVLFWSFLIVLALVAFALGRIPLTPLKARHWLFLGLGLSQVPIWAPVIIAGWLLALGWRKDRPVESKYGFGLVQLALVPWTITALVLVFVSIKQGLLGVPDMQIQGNNSSPELLRWFQDRSPDVLLRSWVFSLPIYLYRLAMLLWAMWLALALIGWLKWAWQCYSAATLWKPWRKAKTAPAPATPPPLPTAPPEAETPETPPTTE